MKTESQKVVQLLINQYEELINIAEVQRMNGYSRRWFADEMEAKHKLAVLKELKVKLDNSCKDIAVLKCYNKQSKVIAYICCEGISGITWHDDGAYIYWETWDDYYEMWERKGCIICEWTKRLLLAPKELMKLELSTNVPVIRGNEEDDHLIIIR